MIAFLDKEEGDKLLLDFLLEISKINGSKRCAEESIKIMEDFSDSQLIISLIVINSLKINELIPPHIIDFETSILSALATTFSVCDEKDIPNPFKDIFSGTEEEVVNRVGQNKKMIFAVQQFVSAYYQYDLFENKYPEISKML